MDSPPDDFDNLESGDLNWENAEEFLIPIDRSHLTDDIIEAGNRADEQLETDKEQLDELIEQMDIDDQTQEQSVCASNTEVSSNDSVEVTDNPVEFQGSSSKDQESERVATTELGYSHMIEGGVETPERTFFNDISEVESNGEIGRSL